MIQKAESMPLVSIAITAFNSERFLIQCLESALHQTYRPVEVIVVDDGSTDGTYRLLQAYRGRLRAFSHQSNLGIAAARNRALRLTSESAHFVAILDSDDRLHPRFVERCAAYLEGHPEVGLVYTDDTLVAENGRQIAMHKAIEPWNVEVWLRTWNLRGDAWLARRPVLMGTRLHDERLRLNVDSDLFFQMIERTTFAHLPESLVYIRQHPGQASADRAALLKCLAANLVRYGYSPEYAYLRARRNPEWIPAIQEGIELGGTLRTL